jgi:sugar/nucleoside kinase (ribokinase family)
MEEPRVVKQSDIDWLLSLRIVNAEKAIEQMKRDRFIVVIDDKELLLDELSRRGTRPKVSVPVGQIVISSEECESIIQTQEALLKTFKIAREYGIVKVVDQNPKKKRKPIIRKKKVLRVTQKELDESLAKYSSPESQEFVRKRYGELIEDGDLVIVNDNEK